MNVLRNLIFVLVLLIHKSLFCGCTGPSVRTSIGVGYDYPYGSKLLAKINNLDSFFVYPEASNCMSTLSNIRVFLNSSLIYSGTASMRTQTITVPQRQGHYKITAVFSGNMDILGPFNCDWQFDLVLTTDSLGAIPLAIPEKKPLNPELLFYPNPVINNLTLLNESEQIKNVMIYNLTGQLINSVVVYNTQVNIPMENYSAGIYIISVATLSDKIIIKKITVL